jgi:phosphatidylglycerophosphate synthase
MTGKPWDQRFAAWLVRPLVHTSVTPNMMTTIGLGFGLGAALLFAQGERNWAGVLFVLAMFWDHTDGELARQSGKTSKFGHHYDHVVAFLNYFLAFLGMGIGYAENGDHWTILAGGLAGLAIAGIFALRSVGEVRVGKTFTAQPMIWGFEIEDLMYVVGPLAWLGWLDKFLFVAAIGAPLYLVWTCAALYRHKRA